MFGGGELALVGVKREKFQRAQVQGGRYMENVQTAVPARNGVAFGQSFREPVNVRPVGSHHHHRAGKQRQLPLHALDHQRRTP